jgi:glucose/arabinose dehydrogenase
MRYRLPLLAAVILSGLWQAAPSQAQSATSAAYRMEVVSDALSYPWDITSIGDRLVLTEVEGNIILVEAGELTRYGLSTTDAVVQDGGGGLLGIAVAPGFDKSGRAFVYHTYRSVGQLMNKVVEVHFDGTEWRETRILLSGIPGHRLYNGGRLAIGPDGYLHVTTGWTENLDLAQNLDSLAGKVLRMAVDGSVPGDNPFADSYVYSYGHRNPQGLASDADGRLHSAEHGQSGNDEINLIEAGENYGWPLVQGDETSLDSRPPVVHSGSDTWAPSGIAFSDGKLLVAALAARALYGSDSSDPSLELLFTSGERYRDVIAVGSDLYVITTNRSPRASGPSRDRLIKLTPAG